MTKYNKEKRLEIFKIIVIEYWINGKNQEQIGKILNIRTQTIQYWMDKFKIPRRERSVACKKDWDNLSYVQKHNRMREIIPPTSCVTCGKEYDPKPYVFELTNLNHKYNNIIEEWVWKCKKCHIKYDYDKGFRKMMREEEILAKN